MKFDGFIFQSKKLSAIHGNNVGEGVVLQTAILEIIFPFLFNWLEQTLLKFNEIFSTKPNYMDNNISLQVFLFLVFAFMLNVRNIIDMFSRRRECWHRAFLVVVTDWPCPHCHYDRSLGGTESLCNNKHHSNGINLMLMCFWIHRWWWW